MFNKTINRLTPLILLFLASSVNAEKLNEPIYSYEEVIEFINKQHTVNPSYKLYKFEFDYISQEYDVEFAPFGKGETPTCLDCGQMFIVPNKPNPIVRHPLHG